MLLLLPPLSITPWEESKLMLILRLSERMDLLEDYTLLEKLVEKSTERTDLEETPYWTVLSSEELLEELLPVTNLIT